MPSRRAAVVRRTASAAPGRSMKKRLGVVGDVHDDVGRGARGRGRRLAEHDGHLAEHGAGAVDAGEGDAVALDGDLPETST